MQRAMRKANWTNPVVVVDNGEAAVAYLGGAPPYQDRERYPLPGLILLDLKLPRKGGLEVLAWLRAQPRLRRLPVVILTSSREHGDIAQAYDLGVNSYLVKPGGTQAWQELMALVSGYWTRVNESPLL